MQPPQHYEHDDAPSSLGSEGGGFDHELPRIFTAGEELESLCRMEISGGGRRMKIEGFPRLCLPIVFLLPGNHCCCDCGDEDRDRLRFASIGYGTLLCPDCANRHINMSEEESRIKSLEDDRWNLRSTLTLLEGGNGKMLDYIKHKPRWRPPKSKFSREAVAEDVLAFQLIYLSKAACAYRKDLLHEVDEVFYGHIRDMRKHDAEEEERLQKIMQMTNLTEKDPFARLFANKMPSLRDTAQTMAVGGGMKDSAVGVERKGRNMSTSLSKHKAPSVDLIKQRIEARRRMNHSIASKLEHARDFDGEDISESSYAEGIPQPFPSDKPAPKQVPQDSRLRFPSHARRRATEVSGGMVGEVGGTSIQEHDDQFSNVSGALRLRPMQQNWSSHQQGDDRTGISYGSRSRAPPLGVYQRFGAEAGGQ